MSLRKNSWNNCFKVEVVLIEKTRYMVHPNATDCIEGFLIWFVATTIAVCEKEKEKNFESFSLLPYFLTFA